ncbi:MAG TPA: GDP-mannose 4,6-dehydratase [Candidatus Cybelea sp.]|jgi:GDP-4-dehydro-6-deoxy-D-mannose reductase|nr:GDP-mannose 4,6-dehydratase [Candidatus Cybelea sp.]
MRALVTGASGFVGRHLLDALRRDGIETLGCGGPNDADPDTPSIDVNDLDSMQSALATFRPTIVFHLAAQSFVPDALQRPAETYEANAMGTARLAQAVRQYSGPAPRIVFASSAEVYGARDPAEYPLRESLDLRPRNPYGASKAAAEMFLASEARSFGADVVIARAFNHIGPGQREHFAIASFAAQLARIAAGAPPQLFVGNLEVARDFLDVRDVAAAYIALARKGEQGEVYNVCSGAAVTIRDVLRELIGIARVPVEVREDAVRVRAVEIPVSVGNPEKLRARTGWAPRMTLMQSLRDVYAAARERVAVEALS